MEFGYEPGGALLIIDMLNDFINPRGSLVVPGADRIVPRIKELREAARSQGIPVVYLTDKHRPDDREFRHWPAHAVEGTWGGEIIDELKPLPEEYVIPKRRYSAFFGTDLDIYLRELRVGHIYETGVLTNICVYATALDASMRLYQVTVFKDAVASLSDEIDQFIFRQLKDVIQAEVV